jgi:hypothetical protein
MIFLSLVPLTIVWSNDWDYALDVPRMMGLFTKVCIASVTGEWLYNGFLTLSWSVPVCLFSSGNSRTLDLSPICSR